MEAAAACVRCQVEKATTRHGPIEKAVQEIEEDLHNTEMKINIPNISVFEKAAQEFTMDMSMVEKKMHRYPAMIRALGDYYTIPTMVAIGPYHHGLEHLKAAEELKRVAAFHCINESGHSAHDMYNAVVLAAYDARILYDKYVMAGISDDDFLPMMFHDACFLVQYMISFIHNGSSEMEMDSPLGTFLASNKDEIFHDIMLLENQIPWRVVEVVMRFRPVPLEALITSCKCYLQHHKVPYENPAVLYDNYEPPHLLGLLRFYIVGRTRNNNLRPLEETGKIPFSANATELAEMGFMLRANNTTELIHMGIRTAAPIFAVLSLTPLSLMRANCLVNMAALELRTTLNFRVSEDEDSAVCSYLLLFAKLVDTEQDVDKLRTQHLLQAGGGLTDSEALKFFKTLQGLRVGSSYVRIMEEIEDYKDKWPVRIQTYAFLYKNKKTIIAFTSVISTLSGLYGAFSGHKAK